MHSRTGPGLRELLAFACALLLALGNPFPASAADDAPPPAAKGGECKAMLMLKMPVVMEGLRASIPVSVNGKDTRFWLDSGAFFSFMSEAKAQELGLSLQNLPFGFTITGVGGSAIPRLGTAKAFTLVGITLKDVQFVVGGSDAGNALLGLNLLALGDTEYDLANGVVNLFRIKGCNRMSLAYWAGNKPVNAVRHLPPQQDRDQHIYAEVTVNGKKLRAMFDTGAPTSSITRRSAELAGLTVKGDGAVSSYSMTGIGTGHRASWIVRVADFGIGDEHIQNTPMRVIDQLSETEDVVLGADFFLAHHIFVSRAQNLIYMTYNGGPIFSISTDGEVGARKTVARDMDGDEKIAVPTTADGFAGRGSGRLARGDRAGALADYDEAIRLAPERADLRATRARLLLDGGQTEKGLADLDAAIRLSPKDHDLLTTRAELRLRRGERAEALVDVDAANALVPRGSLDGAEIAALYERLGRADKGLALLDPIIDLHKEDSAYPELLNNRCWARGLANVELAGALDDCSKAIRKLGPQPSLLDSRALVQLRLGNLPAALADADAALAKRQMPTTLLFRALAHKARGEADAAATDIAAARKLEPAIGERFAAYGLAYPAK